MPTEDHNSDRPHQVVPQGVLALMPPLKILATIVGAALFVWGLLFVYLSSPAWAADITVTSTEDVVGNNGECTLREAILNANSDNQSGSTDCAAGSAKDTITFDLGPSATITLDSTLGQLPTITDAAGLTIDGGSADITIDGGGAVRPFLVASGAKLSLNELTLTKGNTASNDGGAIRNQGTLEVSNSTLSGNTSSFDGGAIFNQGTLTVSNSTFSDNSAVGGVSEGGAINNTSSGRATVSNSTFSGNSAINGGAIFNRGTLEVSNSTFSGNSTSGDGGGIWNHSAITLTVTNSTFSGNRANAGGGIFNDSGAVTLKNTIVANSPSGGNCAATAGQTITDGGYNLSSDASCITAATSLSGDPMLGDLADNGGPTQTMALQDGSPAIDAIPDGTNGCGTDITQDQRGVSRPQGSACDIGAFELESTNIPPTIEVVGGPDSTCLSDTSARTTLKITDADNDPSSLTLSASSSNTNLLPNSNVTFAGSGDTRTATFSTISTRASSTVTITVSDGQAEATTTVNVQAGGSGTDNLIGTNEADILLAMSGNDTLSGLEGSDVLCGASGNDNFTGGEGADHFGGGSGTDTATDFTPGEDTMSSIP
jgi:CSLREA domain-containing protein